MNVVIKMVLLAVVGILATGCTDQSALKKSKLYSVTAEIMVPPGSQQTATAQCNDTDDVILTGHCQSAVPEINFRAFGESNSTYNTQPTSKSGWACTAYNPTDTAVLNQARATCFDVTE
jgi:hypothetical protein